MDKQFCLSSTFFFFMFECSEFTINLFWNHIYHQNCSGQAPACVFANLLSVSQVWIPSFLSSLHQHKSGQRSSPDVEANRWMLLSSPTGPPLIDLSVLIWRARGAAPSMRCTWQLIEGNVSRRRWRRQLSTSAVLIKCAAAAVWRRLTDLLWEKERERKTEEVEGGRVGYGKRQQAGMKVRLTWAHDRKVSDWGVFLLQNFI